MVDISVVDTLELIERSSFDKLPNPAGSAGSYARLTSIEPNRLWRTNYVVAGPLSAPRCVIPIYANNARSWAFALYDPQTVDERWVLPPRKCLLVGGRSDLRATLHLSDAVDDDVLSRLMHQLLDIARSDSRILMFPYLNDSDARRLQALDELTQHWYVVAREAYFDRLLDGPENFEGVGSRVAGVLRRDLRLLAAQELRTAVLPAKLAAHRAAEMIAEHNRALGADDEAELAYWRIEEWLTCADVEVILFDCRTTEAEGVLTALRWRDTLELSEIGLRGERGNARHAVYLELMVHAPLRYAREHGLRSIRAGSHAETPKASRGATFRNLFLGLIPPGRPAARSLWTACS
jgi:hypothetical protein